MDKLTTEEFTASIRTLFSFFCLLAFRELHNGKLWDDAPYIRLMEHIFSKCAEGKIRRLLLNMPPRCLKSMFASVFYPSWVLGNNPAAKIISASYSEDLGSIFSAFVRKLLQCDWYRDAFPNTCLSPDKSAIGHLETTAGGRLYSTTPGGTLAGIGADHIILDDIMKPQNVSSAEFREKVKAWYHNEVPNRFDDPAKGVLIVVMHRLHPDDISAELERSGDFKLIKLPLIEEKGVAFGTPDNIIFEREPGDLLNPSHVPPEEVERIKKGTPLATFRARYQQEPIVTGGGLVKVEWFPRFCDLPEFQGRFQSWDIATTKDHGDYSVCTTWGYVDGKFYLVDVFRKQIEFPDLRMAVRLLDEKFEPTLILIEAIGSGISLHQDLYRQGMKHLLSCRPKEDKAERFEACTPFLQDGNVLIPKHAPWLSDFLAELVEFPQGAHDDQIDSVSQIIGRRVEVLHRAKIASKYQTTVRLIRR